MSLQRQFLDGYLRKLQCDSGVREREGIFLLFRLCPLLLYFKFFTMSNI